ncbi:secreted protein [Melampsora americana]|nr:secreted protein [Melampsora americana]
MLYRSFVKISVLVSTFYLSAQIVSSYSLECRGAYYPHMGHQAWCQTDSADLNSAKLCTGSSCSNKATNTGFVEMENCVWNDRPHVDGVSSQQCVDYEWNDTFAADGPGVYHTFSCTNNGHNHYYCHVEPSKTGFITCDDCQK